MLKQVLAIIFIVFVILILSAIAAQAVPAPVGPRCSQEQLDRCAEVATLAAENVCKCPATRKLVKRRAVVKPAAKPVVVVGPQGPAGPRGPAGPQGPAGASWRPEVAVFGALLALRSGIAGFVASRLRCGLGPRWGVEVEGWFGTTPAQNFGSYAAGGASYQWKMLEIAGGPIGYWDVGNFRGVKEQFFGARVGGRVFFGDCIVISLDAAAGALGSVENQEVVWRFAPAGMVSVGLKF